MLYVTYEDPLKGRIFTEKQMREVYRDLADKTEYADFDIWFTDMLKSGVFETVNWEAVTSYMDDSIRETLHQELAPCTEMEFLTRYLELDPNFEKLLENEFNILCKAAIN